MAAYLSTRPIRRSAGAGRVRVALASMGPRCARTMAREPPAHTTERDEAIAARLAVTGLAVAIDRTLGGWPPLASGASPEVSYRDKKSGLTLSQYETTFDSPI